MHDVKGTFQLICYTRASQRPRAAAHGRTSGTHHFSSPCDCRFVVLTTLGLTICSPGNPLFPASVPVRATCFSQRGVTATASAGRIKFARGPPWHVGARLRVNMPSDAPLLQILERRSRSTDFLQNTQEPNATPRSSILITYFRCEAGELNRFIAHLCSQPLKSLLATEHRA